MTQQNESSRIQTAVGYVLLGVGVAAFAVRLIHDGPYAMPRGATLLGGLGALTLGGLLLWPAVPRLVARLLMVVAAPVVLFLSLYGTMAELEEVVSLYAIDSAGAPAELRLWIVDRDDGEWVGMPRSKAIEYSLDGARLQLLRNGETRCVVPVLYEDRPTVGAIHTMKVEKYAVAQSAAAVGIYPREAKETTVALRLDACPNG